MSKDADRKKCEQAARWVQEFLDKGYRLRGRRPSAVYAAAKKYKANAHTLQSRADRAVMEYGVELVEREEQEPSVSAPAPVSGLDGIIRPWLMQAPRTVAELASRARAEHDQVLEAIELLQASGTNILRTGDRFEIPRFMAPAYTRDGPVLEVISDKDNRFRIGAVGDNHCASKYERRDVMADLYDRFARAGIGHVFHTGNYVDGEAWFNKHDLVAHGIDSQCRLLAETYPARDGITTYAITGDDHEGWYAQKEGIDVGGYTEQTFLKAGRNDWKDIGYMEAHVRLVNANTGSVAIMSVVHPGMGAAYALSYAVQKIIESLEGGEKPAVGLYGHFHKMWAGSIRNVWCAITGCAQDQTPHMRKRRIEAQVGGILIEMEQDPESGAIVGFAPQMVRYFNKGFYSNRWSHHAAVTLPERSVGGL